ncbi:hypothetical protein, partial [Salmonella enterica]|uniref:hypothetical protein n=1 Tax=Salmonella enterica TaxID=28901 RepID=UPI003523E664
MHAEVLNQGPDARKNTSTGQIHHFVHYTGHQHQGQHPESHPASQMPESEISDPKSGFGLKGVT